MDCWFSLYLVPSFFLLLFTTYSAVTLCSSNMKCDVYTVFSALLFDSGSSSLMFTACSCWLQCRLLNLSAPLASFLLDIVFFTEQAA